MGYGDDSILQLILGGTAVCRCDPGVEFRRLYRFDEEHGFRGPAPKGASDFVELTESLKRCPDTKREFSICLAFLRSQFLIGKSDIISLRPQQDAASRVSTVKYVSKSDL